ncbi:hypothetical protein R1flu_029316 [Riccia fluitans]|uniref:SOUL heme-binding protein n=1 Tax=Riccia fluitans TaxID=41844 RepID=A0ABD1XPV0_9MARC
MCRFFLEPRENATDESRERRTIRIRGMNSSRMESLRNFPTPDVRVSLLLALTSQAATQAQRAAESLTKEGLKYALPRRNDIENLEEFLMTVPDLETIPYRVISKKERYQIREVESYLIAETDMPGTSGFDFMGSGQAFNTLADYLFGKNKRRETMEMTTPVLTRRKESQSQKMEMTTPVLTQKPSSTESWRMAFLLPSKFNEENLPIPENSSVKIRRVPAKLVAVTAFSGYVTDNLVKQKEGELRRALQKDGLVRVKDSVQPEIAQYNPPFTPPFMRRNELSVEVKYIDSPSN